MDRSQNNLVNYFQKFGQVIAYFEVPNYQGIYTYLNIYGFNFKNALKNSIYSNKLLFNDEN